MAARVYITGMAASLLVGALAASPVTAQTSPSGSAAASPPSEAQIGAFSRGVGINETCARAYLTANNNAFPPTLGALQQFMVLAPAADLCSPGAVASAQNNTPAPSAAQITDYARTVGLSDACIHAFVLHANSLPTSQAELTQFQQAAPLEDHCTPAAAASPSGASSPGVTSPGVTTPAAAAGPGGAANPTGATGPTPTPTR